MSSNNNAVAKKSEKYTLVYRNNQQEQNNQKVDNRIEFSSFRELELLKLALGNEIEHIYIGEDSEIEPAALKNSRWNYRNPQEMYDISTKIPISSEIVEALASNNTPIEKHMVHKQKGDNVLISEAMNQGNVWYFKGFSDIAELNSDHLSDHVDGIKLFEALRQATLASLHLNGLQHNGVVALTNFKIDYMKYVELDEPYFIQAIPACEKDGGAMFCVFNIIQGEKVVTKGFLGAYTYRSKEIYLEKRHK